jgi:hypothetical protein
MNPDEQLLWSRGDLECVMVSCCSGAELQLRRTAGNDQVVILRELYPTKSDLYERSHMLARENSQSGSLR